VSRADCQLGSPSRRFTSRHDELRAPEGAGACLRAFSRDGVGHPMRLQGDDSPMDFRVVGPSRGPRPPPLRSGRGWGRGPWSCSAEALPAVVSRTPLSETHLVPLGLSPSAFLRVASKTAPPSTSSPVSTPAGPRPCFDEALPHAPYVPPSWVLTTLTVCSTDDSQACCILLPTLGFIGFWRSVRRARRDFRASPPMPCPPERSPPKQPYRTSPCGRAPLPLRTSEDAVDFEALFRWGVRCDARPLPAVLARGSPGLPSPGACLCSSASRSWWTCRGDRPTAAPTLRWVAAEQERTVHDVCRL
jgi:hypothetical protein